jgi:hypothetical protein
MLVPPTSYLLNHDNSTRQNLIQKTTCSNSLYRNFRCELITYRHPKITPAGLIETTTDRYGAGASRQVLEMNLQTGIRHIGPRDHCVEETNENVLATAAGISTCWARALEDVHAGAEGNRRGTNIFPAADVNFRFVFSVRSSHEAALRS